RIGNRRGAPGGPRLRVAGDPCRHAEPRLPQGRHRRRRPERAGLSPRAAVGLLEPVAMKRARGFTLLEVLIALAIMATLAVTAYRALSGMLDGEVQVAQERDRWRDLDLFFTRFEHDVGHMLPRAYRLGDTAFPGVFLRDDAIALVRGAPGEPPQR